MLHLSFHLSQLTLSLGRQCVHVLKLTLSSKIIHSFVAPLHSNRTRKSANRIKKRDFFHLSILIVQGSVQIVSKGVNLFALRMPNVAIAFAGTVTSTARAKSA